MKKVFSLLSTVLLLSGCVMNPTEPLQYADVYFVSDTPQGLKLFYEKRGFSASESELAETIVKELVSGTLQPLDVDYVNLWDSSTSLNSLQVTDGIAQVDLNFGSLNVGAEAEMRAIDQITWTLTGIAPITKVQLLVDGKKIESLAGHVDASQTFSRGLAYETLNNLQITSMFEGEILGSPVVISGDACTFEANVSWQLSSKKEVLKEGSTTAAQACPVRSEWEVQLGELDPGDYEFTVFEYWEKDGSVIAVDGKSFKIQ